MVILVIYFHSSNCIIVSFNLFWKFPKIYFSTFFFLSNFLLWQIKFYFIINITFFCIIFCETNIHFMNGNILVEMGRLVLLILNSSLITNTLPLYYFPYPFVIHVIKPNPILHKKSRWLSEIKSEWISLIKKFKRKTDKIRKLEQSNTILDLN